MKVKFYAHVDINEEIVDLPEYYTDEEIEEEWKEWKIGQVDSGWVKVEDESLLLL